MLTQILGPKPARRERAVAKGTAALLGVVVALCLGGCSGSSNNSNASFRGGAGDSAGPGIVSQEYAATSTDFAAAAASDNAAYKIGPMDVLEISVFKVPDLSKSVQVSDKGTVNLPLLGQLAASGKTAQEFEQELTTKLGAKYLKNPQVTVYVKDHLSQKVTIEGAVKTPGVYPINGRLSLLQLVANAGSVNNDTYSNSIVVFRMVDGNRTSATFDIDAIKSGKLEDPKLQNGDVVVVDTSTAKVAFQNTLKVLPVAGLFKPF